MPLEIVFLNLQPIKPNIDMKNRQKEQETAEQRRKELAKKYYDNADLIALFKVSYATIYRWRKNNILKYCMVGSKYYYPKEAIDQMMTIRNA
jgi:hypothetical protein